MNYTKPEVAILGDAACVIQNLSKKNSGSDAISQVTQPAYDLDE